VATTVYQDIATLIRQELSPQQTVDYVMRHKKLPLHRETESIESEFLISIDYNTYD
jgi:hypothetical protein